LLKILFIFVNTEPYKLAATLIDIK
jgi:hypothetical protein